jgi:hypothetical protein
MVISLASSRAYGFKKWSDAHKRTVDSTQQITVITDNCDGDFVTCAVAERPRGPWLVPGVGTSI